MHVRPPIHIRTHVCRNRNKRDSVQTVFLSLDTLTYPRPNKAAVEEGHLWRLFLQWLEATRANDPSGSLRGLIKSLSELFKLCDFESSTAWLATLRQRKSLEDFPLMRGTGSLARASQNTVGEKGV